MIKLYRDREWLEKKYINEELSESMIGKLCGTRSGVISKWLRRFSILTRPCGGGKHRKANHCNLSQKATEWINGELLGDGSLSSKNNYSACFEYGSKYLEYIEYIRDALDSFGIKMCGKIRKRYHKKFDCYSYHYSSLKYRELLELKKKWYLNGDKIIPKDIKLIPLTLRQFYIGDGSLRHREKRKPSITLATCGFSIFNVEWLMGQLNKLGFKVTRQANNNVIYVSSYSTKDFLNYIGKCPVHCYKYKFAYEKVV